MIKEVLKEDLEEGRILHDKIKKSFITKINYEKDNIFRY